MLMACMDQTEGYDFTCYLTGAVENYRIKHGKNRSEAENTWLAESAMKCNTVYSRFNTDCHFYRHFHSLPTKTICSKYLP